VYICICHVFVGIVFSIRHLFVSSSVVFSPVGLSTAFRDENGTIYVYVTYEFVHIHSQFSCVVFPPIGLTNDVYMYIYACMLYVYITFLFDLCMCTRTLSVFISCLLARWVHDGCICMYILYICDMHVCTYKVGFCVLSSHQMG